ncbi:ABC transporter ATP-binding protein [Isoptericola aurantiacus]|uniref:ABC transporter ATP-binding protein n=1 Tax=Isoptericola aurantiacus TaxID=3377839 RepID=UPI003839E13F
MSRDRTGAAGSAPRRRSLMRFGHLVRRSIRIVREAAPKAFTGTVLLQVVNALLLSGQVLAVKLVLDTLLDPSADAASAALPIVLLAATIAGATVLGSLTGSIGRFLGESVARNMLEHVLTVASRVPLRYFESTGFYDRLVRVQGDAISRPNQVTQGLISMIGALAASIAMAATLVSIYPPILVLLVVGGVPLFLANRRAGQLEFRFTVDQTPTRRMRGYLTYILGDRDAAKEIRSFTMADSLLRRFTDLYDRYLKDLRRHLVRRTRLALLGSLATSLMLALTLLVVVWLISTDRASVAEAGAAVVAIRLLQGQVQALYAGMQVIFEAGLFLDDVDEFLDLEPATTGPASPTPAPTDFEQIEASGIGFTYPGSDRPAVAEIDLTIRSGEVVALVGENGSGKTTLAKILSGLYAPDSGSLTWDGADVATIDPESYRGRVAVIFQDFVRFAFSARDNIAPRGDGDDDAVERAAAASGATGVLGSLPSGLDTMLSRMFDDGVDLSGGQWQRVAIARAFYKDAPLVILDEPTAALDPRAEHALFRDLRSTLDGRAAVFVSHRFSTVRDADRIVVLHDGRIVEEGSHDDLMDLGGRYAELFRLQARAYTT